MSNPKKQRAVAVAGTFGSPDAARQRLLEACGFSEDVQADLVKEAIAGTREAMNAKKSVVVAVGNDVIEVEVADNVARQKARDQVFDLTGVRAPRTNATTVVKTIVEIDWPDFMRPEVLDVTPVPIAEPSALLPTQTHNDEAQ